MKTTLFLVAMIFMQSATLIYPQDSGSREPQENIATITFDFQEKKFTEGFDTQLENLKNGDYYQIRILKINPNAFIIKVNNSDSTLARNLTTPGFGNFELEAISSVLAGVKPFGTAGFVVKKVEFEGTSSSPAPINDDIQNFQNRVQKCMDALITLKDDIDRFKLDLEKYSIDAVKDPYQPEPNEYKVESAFAEVFRLRQSLSELRERVRECQDEYNDFSQKNSKTISSDDVLKTNDEKVKSNVAALLTTIDKATASIDAEKSNALLQTVAYLKNDMEYTSMPFQYNGEYGSFTLKFKPRKPEYNLQEYATKVSFPIHRMNYVSIGASFYLTGLGDEGYSSIGDQVNDSTVYYTLVKEDPGNFELGIATLLRYGIRINDDHNMGVHFSLGPGVSISNTIKPRVLAGVGGTLGERHMFALDLGLIAGPVNVLSNGYDTSTPSAIKPENVIVSKQKAGGFIAIGYLFSF